MPSTLAALHLYRRISTMSSTQDHCRTDRADADHGTLQKAAAFEFLKTRRRKHPECERRCGSAEVCRQCAGNSRRLNASKGRAVKSQRTGRHFGNCHDVIDLCSIHPAVREHLGADLRNHAHTAEAAEANFHEAPIEPYENVHALKAPFWLRAPRSEARLRRPQKPEYKG